MGFPRYFGKAAICTIILSGCSVGPSVQDQPTPTPVTAPVPGGDKQGGSEPTLQPVKPSQYTDAQGLPFPVPSTEANPILTVSRESAWGSNLDITEIPAILDDGYILTFKAVSEDGKTIVGRAGPTDRKSFAPPKLVLMDVASRQVTEIAKAPDESGAFYTWVNGVSMDQEWVVWPEGRILQVYNITTRQRSEIQMRDEFLEAHMPIKETISVDHGIAVWAEKASEKPGQDRIASVVKSVELATGETSVLAPSGMNPMISWPMVIWIEPDLTTIQEGQVLSRLVTLNLETGAHQVMSGLLGVDEVAAYGETATWQGWGMNVVVLQDFAETRKQIIAPLDTTGRQNLTINERLVAWDSARSDVWDREIGRLIRLNETRAPVTVRLQGRMLAWQTDPSFNHRLGFESDILQPEEMKIYLLDTTTLNK
jgi:hypothetical protein